ncbi:MAG: EAL domain-containing protein [Xenococcaceae cyanobacterium MO_188.B19]|nr:EAL domain-containing protein [Xenococcaceae cyanobacterium MO_188.B19]
MAINILIVDDNPANLRLLSDILREQGYQARRAISGSLALKSLEATIFDLILMDINLPGMNGYEICEKIKQNSKTKHIPVIFISAYDEPLDKVKAFKVGGTDYITKPLNNEEVIARIENQIKIIRLQREISLQNIKLKQQYLKRTEQLEKTEQSLQKSQKELLDKSLRDNVTGLENRVVFMGKLREACRKLAINNDYNFCILVIECKYLALYNHLLNFEIKNRVLSKAAKILRESLPEDMTLARLDDNNFVILLSSRNNSNNAIEVAKNLYSKFQKPLILDSKEVFVDFYCGISSGEILKERKENPIQQGEFLLKAAKMALFQAIELNNSQYNSKVFTAKLDHDFKSKLNLKVKLLNFIEKRNLRINYLPVINLKSKQIKNLYAEINWDIFQSKKMAQEEIMSLVNNHKCLELLNNLLIEKSCNEIRKWQEQTLWDESSESIWDKNFSFNIPLSVEQFFQGSLYTQIKVTIQKQNVDGENICLEIPEGAVLSKPVASESILRKLKELNIQLSISNFSANYFALNQKYKFPFDNLVINSSFIQDISDNKLNKDLIRNMIAKVHEHKMTITVAGITKEQQVKELKELGCDYGKGDWVAQHIDPELIL